MCSFTHFATKSSAVPSSTLLLPNEPDPSLRSGLRLTQGDRSQDRQDRYSLAVASLSLFWIVRRQQVIAYPRH